MLWANVVNALLGIWFIIAPSVLAFMGRPVLTWTSIAGGVILLVLAGWAVLSNEARLQAWLHYVNSLIGIWFILAPFVLSVTAYSTAWWTSLVSGVIVTAQRLPRPRGTAEDSGGALIGIRVSRRASPLQRRVEVAATPR